jgi:Ca2+-binding RTX toxin-like protein
MATTFFATSAPDNFVNTSDTFGIPNSTRIRTVFDDNSVNYGFSTSAVRIDLERNPQAGGFASGDTLVDIFRIFGTNFDDEIKGSDLFVSPEGPVENNPGDNILMGFGGNDFLEGRGGADLLDGGAGSDTASYESSPAAVIVTVNNPATGSFSATGGDATGDSLFSIENLIGSRFNDTLTGSSNNNVLIGGRGSDTLDGQGGTDTAVYSLDLDLLPFADASNFVDRVVVRLGLNGATGTATEFRAGGPPDFFFIQTVDTLISIENIIGTPGGDIITGNQQGNTLDGRDGDDLIDGGLGSDTLIGGPIGDFGTDIVSFASHDSVKGQIGSIALGLNGADGLARHATTGPNPIITESDVLRGFENVTGSNLAEAITGNERVNVLDGRGGNDTLDGGVDDRFVADVIIGGDGIDTVSYVSHDAALFGISDAISLGQNGADGRYARDSFAFGIPAEIDVLRGIENVTGSNRPEIITGNEQDNTLSGRGGNDLLAGKGGNDTVFGGAGDDVYDFTGVGGGLGTDRFFDESGTNDRVIINGFNDILPQTGRDGNDLVIVLTAGTFRIVDHFNGHQIETIATPDGQSMVLANGLVGGNGSGIIGGTHQGETLDGRGGDDFLFAGNGGDRLIGGDGDDRLSGGHGPDTFVFGPGFGHDIVTDFSHADHIEFDGGVFQNFKQVQAASHQVGNDTVITLDADNSITLLGVTSQSLHASDFDFG